MEIYKQLLDTGFTPVYFNNGNLEGYMIESRLNYRQFLNLEKYKGTVDLIIELLDRDKYFWLNNVDNLYIEIDEHLKCAELYWEYENDREAINITDKFEDILKLLPKDYEYETLKLKSYYFPKLNFKVSYIKT